MSSLVITRTFLGNAVVDQRVGILCEQERCASAVQRPILGVPENTGKA